MALAGNYPSVAANAFSVVDRTCATGYYSFGHEMGHNMGLNHAHGDPTGTGAYPYSYGHKWPGYRSVMAYSPGTRVPLLLEPERPPRRPRRPGSATTPTTPGA